MELDFGIDEWLGVPGKSVSQGRYWWYLPRDGRTQVRPDAVKTEANFATGPKNDQEAASAVSQTR